MTQHLTQQQLADQLPQLYERYAHEWDADRNRGPWLDQGWLERFANLLSAGATVLDLGCGSGAPVGRYLAQRGLHVTGADTSPTLIALCRSRLPEHEWIVADMRGLALQRRFAGVLAWDSFFHLTPADQRSMFSVFAAHAAPSAALMFTTGPQHSEEIGEYRGAPLYHASLDAAEYRRLLDQYGFDVVAHTVEDPTAGGRTVWLAQSRSV